MNERIYLSSPHMSGLERGYVDEAFATNWVAPLGPNVDAFEREFCAAVGSPHAAALSSGTAALHLALQLIGVRAGDVVLVPSLTFIASASPVRYLGAEPVFIDSQPESWNMDPALVEQALEELSREGRRVSAAIVVHLYGQSADLDPILASCKRWGVPVVEDAAEALGASYKGKAPGTLGEVGIYSFNGNKIITTSGGGMLVSPNEELVAHARKLATQAREPAPHYEHAEIGYNYRLSNICAGIGRGQLRVLEDRVNARRRVFDYYKETIGNEPGIELMPEAPWGRHTRWLSTLTVDAKAFGAGPVEIREALEKVNIEARPVWKPLHMQPVFAGCRTYGGEVAERLFTNGLCLPSSSHLTTEQLERVVDVVLETAGRRRTAGASATQDVSP